MTSYKIEICENDEFYLYIDGKLSWVGPKPWIIDHLFIIAEENHLTIPKWFTSESEVFYYLKDHGLDIDVGDW